MEKNHPLLSKENDHASIIISRIFNKLKKINKLFIFEKK